MPADTNYGMLKIWDSRIGAQQSCWTTCLAPRRGAQKTINHVGENAILKNLWKIKMIKLCIYLIGLPLSIHTLLKSII